jgi:hypothetical protein
MICSRKDIVVCVLKCKFIFKMHFHSLTCHNTYERGPLKDCDGYYILEMCVQIR